ncbi:MAG: hypothetical protein Q8S96_05560 [Hydrogenophaga sp.]|uniref:hypothetical protein n=1 Tax=Hydrogenophaga sp. TaxID=1904254 RepID=UPI0027252C97|nr:hypothetical protein [Hydrogenophaga sp.]MDO9479423.1 hypothetical protein [Hydrogenophaga sp.]MDP3343908.1 hypothetical protein [Hydrogenophaga sp.]
MNIRRIVFLLFLVFASIGCSQQKPPECFSIETVNLVKDIVSDLAASTDYPLASQADMESMISVGVPTPTAYDKEVKRFTCEGTISIPNELPSSQNITYHTDPETLIKINNFGSSLCPDERCRNLITFTSQTVNDSHVVSVEGVPKWMLSALAFQAHVVNANQLAKSKAEEIAKKEAMVSSCDAPQILSNLKIMTAARLVAAAEKKLDEDRASFETINLESILAARAQIESALSAIDFEKIDFSPEPIRLSCSANISFPGLPGIIIPVAYALEPINEGNGENQNLYVDIKFNGTYNEHRTLIAIREHLISRMP